MEAIVQRENLSQGLFVFYRADNQRSVQYLPKETLDRSHQEKDTTRNDTGRQE
jgi:hypothetical protein